MAEEKKTPLLANRGQTPYIPTGYEGLEQSVQRKRKIADALMAQGLQGPGAGARSWAQLLGSLAQTWAGKSIQKDADKEQADIDAKRQAAVQEANAAFEADMAAGLAPTEMVRKYGSNPWTKDRIKPFEDAMSKGLENQQEYGDLTEVLGPDGKPVTVQINKAGGIRQAPGGFGLPPVITDINGVATALQRQPDGTILPQNLTDSVIRGPDGKPMVNKEALDAKVKVAAAGAPNSQVVVHTGKQLAEKFADNLEKTYEQANAAIATMGAAERIEAALKTGKASVGPWSNWKSYAEKVFGVNKEGIAQRRIIEQGLTQLGVDARKVLEGQGAVSNAETAAVTKAYAGDIDSMTEAEIQIVVDVAKRGAQGAIDKHLRTLESARNVEGTAEFLPTFQLPEKYQRRSNPAPAAAKPKPRAKAGLPPKGATPAKSQNPYSKLLPKPAGGM